MVTSTLSTEAFIRQAASTETRNMLECKKITAVIPLYGFKEELITTIPTLEASSLVREIFLVDDGGPTEDFKKIQELACSSYKAIAVKHSRNLGFSAACNTGVELSDATNDILLINSDSVLSKSSITLLALHSCMEPQAATIGSISNSNGFFSIPCSEKMILALKNGADLVNKTMLNVTHIAHEEVVSNNGYVLYVTRPAIEQVGFLDKAVFGKGYGEESDFCLRAKEKGFINICSFLACGFHQGAGSFGAEKEDLKKTNSQTIRAVHPEYISNLRLYEDESELILVQKRLSSAENSKLDPSVNIPEGLAYIYT